MAAVPPASAGNAVAVPWAPTSITAISLPSLSVRRSTRSFSPDPTWRTISASRLSAYPSISAGISPSPMVFDP
jgi:hypothetical protein